MMAPRHRKVLCLTVHFGRQSRGCVRRHNIMLMSEASQCAGEKSIETFHVHQTSAALMPFTVAHLNSTDPDMCDRIRLTRKALKHLVDVLGIACADRTASQATPLERNEEVTKDIIPHKWAKVPPAWPAKVLRRDDFRRCINELRDLFLSCHGDQSDGSRLTREKTPACWSSARKVVFAS